MLNTNKDMIRIKARIRKCIRCKIFGELYPQFEANDQCIGMYFNRKMRKNIFYIGKTPSEYNGSMKPFFFQIKTVSCVR